MNGGIISGNKATSDGNCGGGGVYVGYATFRIVTGVIYGSNAADTSLRNTVDGFNTVSSAALSNGGTAQRGTFSGTNGAWVSKGSLSTTNNTVNVADGELQ
jgi:hypothetical protein